MENKPKEINICIPRMENSIPRETIFRIFKKLNIGRIERIIENKLKTDENYKRVILKIDWNNTETAETIKTRLINKETVNIVYELPWFWKLVLSNK